MYAGNKGKRGRQAVLKANGQAAGNQARQNRSITDAEIENAVVAVTEDVLYLNQRRPLAGQGAKRQGLPDAKIEALVHILKITVADHRNALLPAIRGLQARVAPDARN